ncbi:MAG: hypothetical protein LBJ46_03805 [Planctomycetota bacterium]|nr:hypothetical protein [Planctomycetota bacterium]
MLTRRALSVVLVVAAAISLSYGHAGDVESAREGFEGAPEARLDSVRQDIQFMAPPGDGLRGQRNGPGALPKTRVIIDDVRCFETPEALRGTAWLGWKDVRRKAFTKNASTDESLGIDRAWEAFVEDVGLEYAAP